MRRRNALLCIVVLPPVLLITYVISILWRVSIAENKYFGRSELIPIALPARVFNQPPTPESYGQKTYSYKSPVGEVLVYRQRINGFQHMYGSALASFELGNYYADRLFCLNEWAEYFLDWNGVEPSDLLDRKKDLANNALGRSIGLSARNAGVSGAQAEAFIQKESMRTVLHDPEFLAHYIDPRVFSLSEVGLGCKYLPEKNIFNFFKSSAQK